MIDTHPLLFNIIGIAFILFTVGWIAYAIFNNRSRKRIPETEIVEEQQATSQV